MFFIRIDIEINWRFHEILSFGSTSYSFVEWADFWNSKTGCATATDIALATGLANNTLTTMIKNLEEQNLVIISPCGIDKRKKYVKLTEQGWSQKEVGFRISQKLDAIFYKGFTEEEIRQFESYQERILANLKEKEA